MLVGMYLIEYLINGFDNYIIDIICVWAIVLYTTVSIAKEKNFSKVIWLVFGLTLPLLSLFIVLFKPKLTYPRGYDNFSDEKKAHFLHSHSKKLSDNKYLIDALFFNNESLKISYKNYSLDRLLLKAKIYAAIEDYPNAILIYKNLIDSYDDYIKLYSSDLKRDKFELYEKLVDIYYKLENYELAKEYWRKAKMLPNQFYWKDSYMYEKIYELNL